MASDYGTPGSSGLRRGSDTTVPEITEYTAPVYDEQQVKAYQQEAMAAGLSGLRRSMREAQAGRYGSPTERSSALRGAYQGYGESLAPIQVAAAETARGRYDIQYGQDVAAEQSRVAAENEMAMLQYQQDLDAEAAEAKAEADKVIVRYNAAGVPIYGTQQEADAWQQLLEAEQAPMVVGLTEASLRPISEDTTSGISLYPETVSPDPAYPTTWFY